MTSSRKTTTPSTVHTSASSVDSPSKPTTDEIRVSTTPHRLQRPPVPPVGQYLLRAVKLMLFGLAAALIMIPWSKVFSIIFVIGSLILAILSFRAEGGTRTSRHLAIVIILFDLGIFCWAVYAIVPLLQGEFSLISLTLR